MDTAHVKALVTIFSAVVCLSTQDVKNGECDVACKREGHNVGVYVEQKASCACIDYLSYDRITRKKKIRERLERITVPDTQPQFRGQFRPPIVIDLPFDTDDDSSQ